VPLLSEESQFPHRNGLLRPLASQPKWNASVRLALDWLAMQGPNLVIFLDSVLNDVVFVTKNLAVEVYLSLCESAFL
jgi:hypothetical protein